MLASTAFNDAARPFTAFDLAVRTDVRAVSLLVDEEVLLLASVSDSAHARTAGSSS
jgi:hypothetical protein